MSLSETIKPTPALELQEGVPPKVGISRLHPDGKRGTLEPHNLEGAGHKHVLSTNMY